MTISFFAYGGHNYSFYLTWFQTFVSNVELTYPGVMKFMIMVL